MRKEEEKVEIRLTLEGDMARRFLELKKKWGFESNTDLLRVLVTKSYEESKPLGK
ncbi:MAG: hypothetical protein ACUVTM_04010 [Candidatus Bathyarchaeia archaeon]